MNARSITGCRWGIVSEKSPCFCSSGSSVRVRKRHRRCPKVIAGGSIDILVEPWLFLKEVLSHEMSTRFFLSFLLLFHACVYFLHGCNCLYLDHVLDGLEVYIIIGFALVTKYFICTILTAHSSYKHNGFCSLFDSIQPDTHYAHRRCCHL